MRFLLALVALSVAPTAEWHAFNRTAGPGASIEIDAGRPAGYRIPRTIYGTFLEPIGRSIYGGLWAQELENPSFEDNLWSARAIARMVEREPALLRSSQLGLPLPWEPLEESQGVRFEPRWGDAANSSRSLLIMALPEAPSGVRQAVWLPVHRVLRYSGSMWIKPVSGKSPVEVSLRRRAKGGEVLARAAIEPGGTGWRRYEFSLELKPGQVRPLEAVDFAIALGHEARALIDQVFLFPADAVDGMDPDMIALARELRTPLVRYGGNFTSGYHWRDGVGPIDRRVSMLNQSWGMPEYNHFGTDEFLRFCQLVHAEPQIALNLGSGTPQEAAEWVVYVNGKLGRQGLLWELGNELYGNWQIGYPTRARIAALTKAYSQAVRRADPAARLIATGQDPDQFREWNAAQLADAPDSFQYLSTHFVVGDAAVRRPGASPEFLALSAFALPMGLERRLLEMKEQAAGKTQFAFTEWLFHGNGKVPEFDNMGGAVCAAGFLNTLMRTADFVPIADMTGLVEFGGIWKKRGQVYGVPAYWAFRMYSTSGGTIPVSTRVSGPAYDVHEGQRRIPEIPDTPYLDVVAALNEGRDRLLLYCVNRDPGRDLAARVKVAGFRTSAARVQTLRAAGILDGNSEEHPRAVVPVEGSLTAGAEFSYTFPPASVTVLELR